MTCIRNAALRESLSDPNLLAHALPGESRAPMRTLLIAANGERLVTDQERAIFTQVTGRIREPGRPVDELVIIKGRRSGGSEAVGKAVIPYLSGLCRWPMLTGGERGVLLVLAQDQKTADQILDYAEDAFRASPILSRLVDDRVQHKLRLTNGIDIEVRAADRRRLRGLTFIAVICDEIAHWPTGENAANPDSEIMHAVRPGLKTTHGPIFMVSSPYSRRGVLWEEYRQFGASGDPAVLVAQGATRVWNSSITQEEIDVEYERDAIAAAAEYGAEFRNDIAGYINVEVVEASVSRGVKMRPPIRGVAYTCFVDPSGGSGADSFAMGIAHKENGRYVTDLALEWRPGLKGFNPEDVVREIATTAKNYRCFKVTGDRWADGVIELMFQRHGLIYEVSLRTKSDIFRDLAPLLNSGLVDLIDDRRLVSQICNLERRIPRGGKETIDHPPNGHDDLANAVAGAITLAALGRQPMRIFDSAAGLSVSGAKRLEVSPSAADVTSWRSTFSSGYERWPF